MAKSTLWETLDQQVRDVQTAAKHLEDARLKLNSVSKELRTLMQSTPNVPGTSTPEWELLPFKKSQAGYRYGLVPKAYSKFRVSYRVPADAFDRPGNYNLLWVADQDAYDGERLVWPETQVYVVLRVTNNGEYFLIVNLGEKRHVRELALPLKTVGVTLTNSGTCEIVLEGGGNVKWLLGLPMTDEPRGWWVGQPDTNLLGKRPHRSHPVNDLDVSYLPLSVP